MEVKTFSFRLEANFGFLKKLSGWFKSLRENLLMDNDLLFTLTYMASLSTANLSRDKIFEMIAEKDYGPSKYFRMIRDLAQKWHYDYATACSLVAEKVKHERLRRLLDRMANAIAAGEPDDEFLEREWRTFKTVRKDEYERSLESLRKWTDAYVSLLVSASLISIVLLLAVVIYSPRDAAATLYSAILSNAAVCGFGILMLSRAVPKDRKTHDAAIKSREQRMLTKMLPLSLAAALVAFWFLTLLPTLLGVDEARWMRGWGFLAVALSLTPATALAKLDDSRVSARDEAFTVFIRSLGSIKSGAGVSLAEAMSRIDEKNLGALKDLVKQLHRRLSLGLDPKLCWERFAGESGSYLIHKFTNIFVDATDMGGDAAVVGEIVASSNLEMVLLRLKRALISSGFINLLIPLHLSMVGLILFITQIMDVFARYISELFATQLGGVSMGEVMSKLPGGLQQLNIGIFSVIPFELMNRFTVFTILSLTIANTIAANIVRGSGGYMLAYYAAIFFMCSGLLMLVIPPLVDWMFTFPSFVE
ncbi:MAG: archaellar assembly protein FlaJ [Archaeoglobaceae archaeon]